MLTRWRCRGQTGSGMAIGVAMIFPMLMLVIVSLQMLTETSPHRAGTPGHRQPGRPHGLALLLPHRRAGREQKR